MTSITRNVALVAVLVLGPLGIIGRADAQDLRLQERATQQPSEDVRPSPEPMALPTASGARPDGAVPVPVTTGAVGSGTGPARVTKVAQPWCPSGRISGSGAGFCLLN